MFNGNLPIVKMNVREYDTNQGKYIEVEKDVEILTINLNTGSIRVRHIAKMFSKEKSIQCENIYDSEFVNNIIELIKANEDWKSMK